LVGVGFSAVGWSARPPAVCGPNRPYKQEAGSFDPRAQFIFENVGPEELIGDFESLGLGRGAAGDEIDRADASLGTPHHALLLARASSFSGEYLPTAEEVHLAQPWLDLADKVRADMVYFECPNGGAVFSTGSVSWLSCLSHNGYENTVSRITANVMKRFVS
jgi:N,N-dimethylformamidase